MGLHAITRRMPAERARHAKRLGHVQPGLNLAAFNPVLPNTSSATTTTQSSSSQTTPSTTASSNQSPVSSARPSSTIQSSSASSSATTSSTPSIVLLTTDAPSTSLSMPPTISASLTPSAPASHTDATAGGLSGSAVAGIITGGVIIGVALIMFFVRKTYLRRRERKRVSWTGTPGLGPDALDDPKLLSDISERPTPSTNMSTAQRNTPLSPFEPHGQFMHSAPVSPGVSVSPTIPTYVVPTPPRATYNNPTVAPYYAQAIPSAYGPGNTATLAMARAPLGLAASSGIGPVHAPVEAAVKFSFVPTLPDELSITTGERIFIIEQYDDGWNLCANGRGERGMVPRECLDAIPSDQFDIGWRNVKRMSSLNPDERRV